MVPESQEQGKVGDPSFDVTQHHVAFESPSVDTAEKLAVRS